MLDTIWQHVWPTVISVITGAAVFGCIIAPFKKVWKKAWRALDSIDPSTDTGITKQLKAIERSTSSDHHIR